jgi:hypothetical protein
MHGSVIRHAVVHGGVVDRPVLHRRMVHGRVIHSGGIHRLAGSGGFARVVTGLCTVVCLIGLAGAFSVAGMCVVVMVHGETSPL